MDPAAVHFARQGERETARIGYAVVAYAPGEQKALNVGSGTVSAALDGAQFQAMFRDGLRARQLLKLPPGPLILRVGVEQLETGRVGSVEFPLNISPGSPAR